MATSDPPRPFRSGPGDSQPNQDRKRKRLATVCLPCRTRKLKCDKEYPACSRCHKSGKPEQCTYEEAAIRELRTGDSTTPRTQSTPRSIVVLPDVPVPWKPRPPEGQSHQTNGEGLRDRVLEDRIQLLERLVVQQSQGSPASNPIATQQTIIARLPEPALIISSLVSDFHDFRPITKQLRNQNPLLGRLIRELNNLKNMKPAKALSPDIVVDRAFLEKLMPPRDIVEGLVGLYLDYVEPTYRLNYLPTFRAQLNQLWTDCGAASAELIVQLLLMMATVWSLKYSDQPLSKWRKELTDQDPLALSHDTFNHLKAGYWVLCCEDWIHRTKMKHPDTATLCLQAHLIMAKDANRIRYKHEWVSTGDLVKMAMSVGLHREPRPPTKAPYSKKKLSQSTQGKELRRRMWATIVELDLKASMDKGMPPTVREADFDCEGPSNIDDEELEENGLMPHSRAANQATDASLQSLLFKSLHVRLRACTLIYSPRFSTTYSELAQLDSQLTRALDDIPAWEEPPSGTTTAEFRQKTRVWRGVLKYKIRHCMLSLHNRLTLLASSHPMLPTSSQARVDLSADILLHHVTTSECFRQLNVLAPLDCYAQAALTLCHHLYTTSTGFSSAVARELVPEMTESLLSITEKLLSEFETKAVLTGKGHKEFLLLATVISLTRIKMKPEDQVLYRQQLVERLATLGYRMLGRMNPEDATGSLQQSLVEEPGATPVSVASGGAEAAAQENTQWEEQFVPTNETTPSDFSWDWDFMIGDWASTEFFSI